MLSLCLTVPMTESLAVVETPPSLDAEIIPEELKEKTDDAATTTTTSYYAEFDCKELPEEGYMQLELIGKNEGQIYADLKFVIKVCCECLVTIRLKLLLKQKTIKNNLHCTALSCRCRTKSFLKLFCTRLLKSIRYSSR